MAQGSTTTIVAELAEVIQGLHTQLKRSDPISAKFFRLAVEALTNDDDSPVWKDNPDVEGALITIPKFKEDT